MQIEITPEEARDLSEILGMAARNADSQAKWWDEQSSRAGIRNPIEVEFYKSLAKAARSIKARISGNT